MCNTAFFELFIQSWSKFLLCTPNAFAMTVFLFSPKSKIVVLIFKVISQLYNVVRTDLHLHLLISTSCFWQWNQVETRMAKTEQYVFI